MNPFSGTCRVTPPTNVFHGLILSTDSGLARGTYITGFHTLLQRRLPFSYLLYHMFYLLHLLYLYEQNNEGNKCQVGKIRQVKIENNNFLIIDKVQFLHGVGCTPWVQSKTQQNTRRLYPNHFFFSLSTCTYNNLLGVVCNIV